MTVRIDLRGMAAVPERRRARVLAELAALAAAVPAAVLEIVAGGEAAFAVRLVVRPGTAVHAGPRRAAPALCYRAFGEANPADLDAGAVLVEAGDLGRVVDGEEGPAEQDALLDGRLRALAAAEPVRWRVAADWQAEVLRQRLGVPEARILRLPARASVPPARRLSTIRLPAGLPEDYLLSLTPVGGAGDLDALVEAHGSLGGAVPPLVVLGVEDEAWRPALAGAVDRAGSRGRVLVLRDLDPPAEAAAIARARAVVAVDRHPAHAVRLRQAAMLERPAVVRRHPGYAAWIDGGRWADDHVDSLSAALREPAGLRLRRAGAADRDADPLLAWLTGAARPDRDGTKPGPEP